MDFTTWLTAWLDRHPLRAPDALDRARYTAQVMRRILDETPSHVPAARWFACLRQGSPLRSRGFAPAQQGFGRQAAAGGS